MKKSYTDHAQRNLAEGDSSSQLKTQANYRRAATQEEAAEGRKLAETTPDFPQKISLAASQKAGVTGQQQHSQNIAHQPFITTNTSRLPNLHLPQAKDGPSGRFHDTASVDLSDMTIPGDNNEKKHGRWTQHEKELFIDALRIYGKDWKKVEQHIKTRSGAQIRSHAQKFFQNAEKTKGMDIDQYIQYLQQQHGTGPIAIPPTSTGQITPSGMSVAAGMAPSNGPTSQCNANPAGEVSQNIDNLSSNQDHPKFKVKKASKPKIHKNNTQEKMVEPVKSEENVSNLSGLSGAGGSSKVSLNSKLINQINQNLQKGKSPTILQNRLVTMRNQNPSQQSGSQSQQNALTSLLKDYLQQNGASGKLRLSPTKLQTKREDMNMRHQQTDSRSNSYMRESPQTMGKTPSFGGLALNQINSAMFAQDEPFLGLHAMNAFAKEAKKAQKEQSKTKLQQQNSNPFKNETSTGFGGRQHQTGPGLATQHLSCQQLSHNHQQPSLSLQGLMNMSGLIGHQGRDRAYSSQSGVPFPSLNKQAKQQQESKLLFSKLLGSKVQYKPSPQTQKKNIRSDVIHKHNLVASQNPAQSFNEQDKQNQLHLKKDSSKQDLLNLIKPLFEKKNSQLSREADRSQHNIHGKSSPELSRQGLQPKLQQMITQLQKNKSYDQYKNQESVEIPPGQALPQNHRSQSGTSQQISPSQNQPKLMNNLNHVLQKLGYHQKQQEQPKLSGMATPQSQNQVDDMSAANTEQGKNALIQQIIKVMQQSKGPQFPPRGISEMSKQSKTSKQGFTHILKQPQAIVGQKVSGDSHSTLSNNLVKRQLQQNLLNQKRLSQEHNNTNSSIKTGGQHSVIEPKGATDHNLHCQTDQKKPSEPRVLVSNVPNRSQTPQKPSQVESNPSSKSGETQKALPQQQSFDHTMKINNLELRKHSLYLNFINDMNSSMQSIGDQETKDLVQKYTETFSEIQGNFLKLYNKEMKYYANIQKQQNQKITSNPEQKTAKNYINHDIVKNMIECLNNQIFLKMLNHLINKLQSLQAPQLQNESKLKDISPINLKIFKQLIPLSYHQSIREKLIKMNEDELNHQVSKSNSSIEESPDEAKLQEINLLKLDTVEDLDGEGSKQNYVADLNSGIRIQKIQSAVQQIDQEEQTEPKQDDHEPQDQIMDDFDQKDDVDDIQDAEENLELPATVNKINSSTFQQIACSLSPEPERLLRQQIQMNISQIHEHIGQKRNSPKEHENDEFEEMGKPNKKQKLIEDLYETPDKQNPRAVQRQQASSTSFGAKQSLMQQKHHEIGMPAIASSNIVGNQVDLGLDVDQIIQGLLQQYQESQIGASTAGGGAQLQPQNATVESPSRLGVRMGGFRQTAYSDSHQELVKRMSGLSPENIQMMSSAGQKGRIKRTLDELQIMQGLGTAMNNQQQQNTDQSNQQKEALEQQLLLHLQNSSPVLMQQLQQSILQDQQDEDQEDEDLLDDDVIPARPGENEGNESKVVEKDETDNDENVDIEEEGVGIIESNLELINPESPLEPDHKADGIEAQRSAGLGLEGQNTTTIDPVLKVSGSPKKSSSTKLSPRKMKSAGKQNQIKLQMSAEEKLSLQSPQKSSLKSSSQKKAKKSPEKSSQSKGSKKQ